MIIKSKLILDLKIKSVEDLYKLKPFEENSSININKSQIARELGVDRRTVDKYINGFRKTGKIKQVAQRQGQTFLEAVNVLLYICYFDMMLIPVNAALGIWRGYEFLYIPRLCMWGFVIYVYTRNLRASTKVIINTLTFIYFVTWFTFRLSRTYEASALMPYIFDMF